MALNYGFAMRFISSLLLVTVLISEASGHARLDKPNARSWIINNCGDRGDGVGVGQTDVPGTRCGVCGDKLDLHKPRPHEHGGSFGKSGPVVTYRKGQVINVTVYMPNPHKGYMQWRICKSVLEESDNQGCFDANLLDVLSATTKYSSLIDVQPKQVNIGTYDRPNGESMWIDAQLRLPSQLTCDQCVMQFNYRAGRTWKNFTAEEMDQETFRSCSDIEIVNFNPDVRAVRLLKNVVLDKCLLQQTSSASALEISVCDKSSTRQQVSVLSRWPIVFSSSNTVIFQGNGNCLDVSGESKNAGASVLSWQCNSQ